MEIKVTGLNDLLKDLDLSDKAIKTGAKNATKKSGEHLLAKIRAKFGVYQSTGGDNGGPWKKLKYPTIVRKRKKGFGATASSPLLKTGKMRDSVKLRISRKGDQATIYSNDPKLKYHVYGAPRKGIPRRDPVLITTQEEEDEIVKIFVEELEDQLSNLL